MVFIDLYQGMPRGRLIYIHSYNNGFTNWPRRGQNRINTAWEASNDYWYPNY
ncbi:hypothetical protein UUU_32010 [Klebsiella pneumoniae subsp. pneumoniae DSM 30104 = JCM 1662 = NBRC 14940]|nr:hypothetical protein UUU_32010 [Klebsiella pneumoniae subsp. pneumoniae DSM 30104 = JCM 1662 = NBRC 14940]